MRKRVKQEPLSHCWAALQALCDGYMDPKSSHCVDYREKKKRIWRTRDSVFALPPAVRNLALAALISGEDKYAAYAREVLLTIIRDGVASQIGGTAYGKSYNGWSGMDFSAIGLMFALGYDLLYNHLDPADRALIRDNMLAPWFEQLLREHQDWRTRPTSNQRAYFYRNACLAALSLYDDLYRPEMDEIIATAAEAVPAYLEVDVGQDGGCAEGAGYAGEIMGVFELRHVLGRAGAHFDLKHVDRIRNCIAYFVRQLLPWEGHINPVNQCFDRMDSDLLLALAREFRDPVAMWAWYRYLQPGDPKGRLWTAEDDMETRGLLWKLLLFDPSLAPGAPDRTGWPLVAAFPDHASADIRTGWGDEDVMFTLQHGPGFAWGMPDMGNFTLHAMGEVFAIDVGYGRWETSSNNCVVVDGKGQLQDWQGNPGGLADFEFLEGVQYARGDLRRQYPGSRRAERHSAFVQPRDGLPWYVVIGDDFEMGDDETHVYDWFLVTAPDNAIQTDHGGRFTVVGKKRSLAGFVVTPEDAALSVDTLSHVYYWSPTGGGCCSADMQHWGDYPRLRVRQRRDRGRFLIVMLPDGQALPSVEPFAHGQGVRLRWSAAVDEVTFYPGGSRPAWSYSRKRLARFEPSQKRSIHRGTV